MGLCSFKKKDTARPVGSANLPNPSVSKLRDRLVNSSGTDKTLFPILLQQGEIHCWQSLIHLGDAARKSAVGNNSSVTQGGPKSHRTRMLEAEARGPQVIVPPHWWFLIHRDGVQEDPPHSTQWALSRACGDRWGLCSWWTRSGYSCFPLRRSPAPSRLCRLDSPISNPTKPAPLWINYP